MREIALANTPVSKKQSEEEEGDDWKEWDNAWKSGDRGEEDAQGAGHARIRAVVLDGLGPMSPRGNN
jgi:hypothetical protein